jgi:hypothetical protein
MEIDETRSRDLYLRDELVLRQRIDQRLRELTRILLCGFGKFQCDAGGEIAVRRIARAFDLDGLSQGFRRQKSGRQRGQRGGKQLFDLLFQGSCYEVFGRGSLSHGPRNDESVGC